MSKLIEVKYIKEWVDAVKVETRVGEHGIASICSNNLLYGEENERAKESINEFIFNVLYEQALNQAKQNFMNQ